jgi:hypothetical protein
MLLDISLPNFVDLSLSPLGHKRTMQLFNSSVSNSTFPPPRWIGTWGRGGGATQEERAAQTWRMSSHILSPSPQNLGEPPLSANPGSRAQPRRPLHGEAATKETI